MPFSTASIRSGTLLVLAAMLVLLPAIALGQTGWGRMFKGGPFAEFRGADWETFRATLQQAADTLADGETLRWENPKTGARGVVKVLRHFDRPQHGECRDLNGRNIARGRTGPFQLTVCRKPGGPWRIA